MKYYFLGGTEQKESHSKIEIHIVEWFEATGMKQQAESAVEHRTNF